jgi:hypothetical protein
MSVIIFVPTSWIGKASNLKSLVVRFLPYSQGKLENPFQLGEHDERISETYSEDLSRSQ